MPYTKFFVFLAVMAGTTYLIRMLPFTLFRKKIQNTFLKSFFYYIPYAVLSAMTFPAILGAGEHVISGGIALAVAVLLALKNRSLLEVAAASGFAVFVIELIL